MGLIYEVQRMNKTLSEQEKQKQAKKEQEQYNKDLLKTYEKRLRRIFLNHFERDGLQKAYINLRLKGYRDGIIGLDELEGVRITYEERDYWDDNYEKILEKTKKIYENDQKARQELFNIEQEERLNKIIEEEKQKQEHKENIGSFILIFIFILLFVFFFYCLVTEKLLLYFIVCIIGSVIFSILLAIINFVKSMQ